MPVIALLSDFGLNEPYVAQIKGIFARMCPGAVVVDLSHGVRPFDVLQAGFYLAASRGHFPGDTVFVCVVDPGVGGPRRAVAVRAAGQWFVAPDNGLLGLVLGIAETDGVRAWDLGQGPLARNLSDTFHGRDLFAPAAAGLVAGTPPAQLGPEMDAAELVVLDQAVPAAVTGGVNASVLHVDRFGNVITNLALEPWVDQLKSWARVELAGPGTFDLKRVTSYGELEPGRLGLISGSQGFVELCLNRGRASDLMGVESGDELRLRGGE